MPENAQDIVNQQLTTRYSQPSVVYTTEDGSVCLEVKVENDTVWLSQEQMANLFMTKKQNVSYHINSIFREGELDEMATVKDFLTVQNEGGRSVSRYVKYFNLDVIISVGYRVHSIHGTRFRQWATTILKNYMLNGYAFAQRFERIEHRLANVEEQQQVLSLEVHGALPPHEGVFFDGQIFDAYVFASSLIQSAKERVILVDNYVDESVLTILDKRLTKVQAVVYTDHISKQLALDIEKHNAQYSMIDVKVYKNAHDRFLLIDNEVYHIGASLKDLGKKLFAFSKMSEITADELINRIK